MNPTIEIYYELEEVGRRSHSRLPNTIRDKATAYVGLSELTHLPMILVNTHSFKFGIEITDLQQLLAQPILEELLDNHYPDRER